MSVSAPAPRLSGAFAESVFSVFSIGVGVAVATGLGAGLGGGAPPFVAPFFIEFFFEAARSLDFFFFFASAMFLASRITLLI